ncbi:hypothetical protein ANN_16080 [Periplaneta americana]|uniref:Uncharacterized protein n=1 Tax=Periplaneta americana TaxID=6978 RepID=A0ABQ8SHZ3_PERAM|nr:hypothetical protein ANN_16080 [Periplaneta americana]
MVYSTYSGFPNGALHLFVNRISEDAQRLIEHIKTLEKIKNRSLKCCRKSSPLKWDTLTDRRKRIRLCALFKTYRGATKEIGTALTRICLRHKAVEARMKTFTRSVIGNDVFSSFALVFPPTFFNLIYDVEHV